MSTRRRKDKLVLLDLGGVLADLGSPATAMGLHLDDGAFWNVWLASSAVAAFETGKISAEEFYEQVHSSLGIKIASDFAHRFANWRLALHDGVEGLIGRIGQDHKIALLSNTNPVHWQQVREATQLFEHFSHLFLSFETGHFKPQAESFQQVSATLGLTPKDIFYFDDNASFVKAADQHGIRASQVCGLSELSMALSQLRLVE